MVTEILFFPLYWVLLGFYLYWIFKKCKRRINKLWHLGLATPFIVSMSIPFIILAIPNAYMTGEGWLFFSGLITVLVWSLLAILRQLPYFQEEETKPRIKPRRIEVRKIDKYFIIQYIVIVGLVVTMFFSLPISGLGFSLLAITWGLSKIFRKLKNVKKPSV